MKNHDCSAIVLAGGASKRFGSNKLKTLLNGKPVLDYVLDACLQTAQQVIVVGAEKNGNSTFIKEERLSYAPDDSPGAGPLAGLHTGLQQIRHECSFVLAGDMPLITVDSLQKLKDSFSNDTDWLCYKTERVQPLFSICSSRVIETARKTLAAGTRSLFGLLDQLNWSTIPMADVHLAHDIDTRPDLEFAEKILSEKG